MCFVSAAFTCSPERRCAERRRRTSALPGALPAAGPVRCWSTAGSRSGRPWNTARPVKTTWTEARGGMGGVGGGSLLFVALDPGVLVLPTVPLLGALDVQLLVAELVSGRCLWWSEEPEQSSVVEETPAW